MRILAAAILPLSLAACSFSIGGTDQQQIEQSMRETLGNQGSTVEELNMQQTSPDAMNGYVNIRDSGGNRRRMNCTANRPANQNFNWECLPTINDNDLRQTEQSIRDEYRRRGFEVRELRLERANDTSMRGSVLLAQGGEELRLDCTGEQEGAERNSLGWHCRAPGETDSASADGGQSGAPAPEGNAPAQADK